MPTSLCPRVASLGGAVVLRKLLPLAAAVSCLTGVGTARAEFASAPESPYRRGEPPPAPSTDYPPAPGSEPPLAPVHSTFRFQVGPALLLSPGSPGLVTALDIGRRAVGARLSATWLRAETARGLASYSTELWVDFRHDDRLHPILGAGASYLRGGALGEDGSAGAGVLRGALEYELPLADADARLGLSVSALVPAIGTERTRPWMLGALTVGAGF